MIMDNQDKKHKIDAHEVQRQVMLAFFLEACLPKEGCTSRFEDVGPKQRFEDFVVSAINTGRCFYELAERINNAEAVMNRSRQPSVIYDLAYKALLASQKTRKGKLVCHGLLEVMFPVVVARCVYASSGNETMISVPDVLKRTSKLDVHYLAMMREEVYSRSDKPFKRKYPFHEEGSNVYEHYQHHQTLAHEVSKLFVGELMCGMPLTSEIYSCLKNEGTCGSEVGTLGIPYEMAGNNMVNSSLTDRVKAGFKRAREMSQCKLPPGAIADFTAAALYLYISDNADKEII